MARLIGIEQQTAAWVVARIGCVTASRVKDVCQKRKSGTGELKQREDYRLEKVNECLDGSAASHLNDTDPMIWGINNQPLAKTEYELANDLFVEPGGFWMHDKIPKFRASPDYLVGTDGLLEIKCPYNKDKHLKTYMKQEIPEEHLWQVRAQLACTGRQWCDFCSFDPRKRQEHLRLVQIRVHRDDAIIHAMEVEIEQFLCEVEQTVSLLGARSLAPADQLVGD